MPADFPTGPGLENRRPASRAKSFSAGRLFLLQIRIRTKQVSSSPAMDARISIRRSCRVVRQIRSVQHVIDLSFMSSWVHDTGGVR